ncbi:hypothetical protein BB737_07725 [Mycobacterium avium subsp. hominissuis]|uniref:Uncharacterized protein n=2 Tax=Mycobacterium TaxID=1763 RepID=A0A1X1Y146_9MYCO|nr:hypothetical protein AWC14_02320 [Mycobacterium kyorinense]PBJ41608.1 hypothetical protein XV03_00085 [Mycobacterium avium subsp. hominissuis]PBJ66403.1 hypothetical protein BB737_07725 [Mycobacterium avium subsp. hominissuis]
MRYDSSVASPDDTNRELADRIQEAEKARRRVRAETHRGNAAGPHSNDARALKRPGKGHRHDWKREL